jgi:Ca2+-binding RTX toxin-like protein
VQGGADRDALFGSVGDDTIEGGDANDRLAGGPGADQIDGGEGLDRALYVDAAGGVFVDLAGGTANTGTDTDTLLASRT